ncbi:MAG: T9SS type A sorting domain-containing protein [Brumimicrobium sp.]
MDAFLKLLGFLLGLLLFNSAIAQGAYIVGQPVNDSLDTLSWSSNGGCYDISSSDFTLQFVDCEVTGLSYVFILTEVFPANSVYTNHAGVINTGDTLSLDGLDHSFFFPDTSVLKGTFKIIGTPEVEGEIYSCEDIHWTHTLGECFNSFEYFFDPNNTIDCEVNPSCYTETIESDTVCDSYYWQADSTTYTASGTYSKTLNDTSGCDSVVWLDLIVKQSVFTQDEVVTCENYTWIDGNTYTSDNDTATYIFTNNAGCDSVVTLNLTISSPFPTVDQVFSCEAYTWIDGNTYSSSNDTATHVITTEEGCDSLIQLDLTISSDLNTDIQITQINQKLMLTAISYQMQYQWIDCNNNFAVISNEAGQSFIPDTNGSYAVVLTDGNCSDTSDCLLVNIAGLDESFDKKFDLFPNPNKGEFEINNKTGALTHIFIVDAIGKVVFTQKIKASQHKIQTDLSAGVYMVHLIQNDSSIVKRMVVN